MSDVQLRYADDPDAYIDWPVTDRNNNPVDWTSPQVIATTSSTTTTLAATWQGSPAVTRTLRVPVHSLPASNSTYSLRLVVPGDNDRQLGSVRIS